MLDTIAGLVQCMPNISPRKSFASICCKIRTYKMHGKLQVNFGPVEPKTKSPLCDGNLGSFVCFMCVHTGILVLLGVLVYKFLRHNLE